MKNFSFAIRFITFLSFWGVVLFLALAGRQGYAQNETGTTPVGAGTTNPFSILTDTDIGYCEPQNGDLGGKYNNGCCGSPGRRGCATGFVSPVPICLEPASKLAKDPDGRQLDCQFPSINIDPTIQNLGSDTFYVTSDIHFFRTTFNLTDQLAHVQVINNFAAGQFFSSWPTGTGLPSNTPLNKPGMVIVDGDLTTHSASADLGAYRLNWEAGHIPDSIQYPVLFGLGNHDIKTDVSSSDDAQRMFDYLQTRMANTNMDSGSGNYSFEWNGVHMVQLNTWAGDKTSLYQGPTSDGLGWLQSDLQQHVGNSTRPVMIFQHYGLNSLNTSNLATSALGIPIDAIAVDANGNTTDQGYETFFNTIQNYNVIGMFSGHDHCLGTYTSAGQQYGTAGGLTFPGVSGYGQPIDDFDDGSGGDTGGQGDADNSAGNGNPCQAQGQTATGSFLITHVNSKYLDVAAVSWQIAGADVYFDPAMNFTNGALACHKRINSQFLAVKGITVTPNRGGYTVTNSTGAATPVPIALQFAQQTPAGFDFVDQCSLDEALNSSANNSTWNSYMLVNGESGLASGATTNAVSFDPTSIWPPNVVAIAPMSGVSQSAFLHTITFANPNNASANPPIAPPDDQVTVYGPANQRYSVSIQYSTSITGWLNVTPQNASFDQFGTAVLDLHYIQSSLQATNEAQAIALIQIQCTPPGGTLANFWTLTQNVSTEIDFKAPVSVTLTATPANSAAASANPIFTSTLTYNLLPDNGNTNSSLIQGVVNLMAQTVDPASGILSAPTSLSTWYVNPSNDLYNPNGNSCNPPANNTAIFGSNGSGNVCESYGGSSTPGTSGNGNWVSTSMQPGLYYLTASYQGTAQAGGSQGDSFYAPASSSPLPYRIGDPLSGLIEYAGNGQSAPVNGAFDTLLAVQVQSSSNTSGGPANALVTFTVLGQPGATNPASASFNASTSATVITGSNGIATAPPLLANGVTGNFQVVANVAGLNKMVLFTLTNLPAGDGAPLIQASVVSKGGSPGTRLWSFALTNVGTAAAGQLTLNNVVFTPTANGSTCAPTPVGSLPYVVTSLLPYNSPNNVVDAPLVVNESSCTSTSEMSVTLYVSANNGAYSTQITIGNQSP